MKKMYLVLVWMMCVGMASSVFAQQPGMPYSSSGTVQGGAPGYAANGQSLACDEAQTKAHNTIETEKNLHRFGHVLTGRSISGCQCQKTQTGWTCVVQYAYQLHPK